MGRFDFNIFFFCFGGYKYQRDEEPRPPSCQEHPRQPLNMYCIQDRQLICGLCLTVGQHHGHPIDDLQAAFAREKATPQQLAELSEHRWAEVGGASMAEWLDLPDYGKMYPKLSTFWGKSLK